jgi:hypothetical protein
MMALIRFVVSLFKSEEEEPPEPPGRLSTTIKKLPLWRF